MNQSEVLLALIADLYAQVGQLAATNEQLRAQLATVTTGDAAPTQERT